MTRKCQVRFGGGRLQKGSNMLHLGSLLPYQGSVSSSQVRIGEVFRPAIQRLASAIVVCHNHPSSDNTPSPDDVAVTRAMVQAGKLLDIQVLDHLVISSRGFVSLKERGLGFS
jgi:DNA repair protein RadC